MPGTGRLILFSVLLCFVEFRSSQKNSQDVKASFEYKHIFEFGSNKTNLLPPILIIPVLIKSLESGIIPPSKTDINNSNTRQNNDKNNTDDVEDDINVGFRQSLNRGTELNNKLQEDSKAKITVRQSADSADNKPGKNSTEKENSKNVTIIVETTMMSTGKYPNTNNSKEDTNNITLTTASPGVNLPPINDNRWHNLTQSTPIFGNETTKEPNSSTNKGPYSAAVYNNGMIDQISITTNSYTNEESYLPSPEDDRWRTFSKQTHAANEFKPLAGLYYDGFLHKPLIMLPGFIPRKYYNLV